MLLRAPLLIFLLLVIYIVNAFLNPIPAKNAAVGSKPKYGVSYSFEQAGWYGLDGRKAYTDLLDQVKFDWVRMPFFWDQMVDENGELKIEDLKFGIEEAKKRNTNVVVALGTKTPYYPEYHLPEKVQSQLKFGDTITTHSPIANDILAVDRKVVEELSHYDNIAYWQVENEPFLASVNGWKISRDLLTAEIKIVRETDSKHRPIILNSPGSSLFDNDYKSLLGILKLGDVLGVSAYFKTQGTNLASFKIFSRQIDISWPKWLVWPVQSWYGFSPNFEKIKKEASKKGVGLWVLEMQSEPYIRTLNDARRKDFYFRSEDIVAADSFLRSSQVDSIGFWGAAFWLYRAGNGDSSWLDAVKMTLNPKP